MILWTILLTGGISRSSRWTPTVCISCKTVGEVVRPELFEEIEATQMNWFTWDKWSNRTPTLSSKCYYMENEEKSKAKLSSKGTSQQQNKHTREQYEEALNGAADKATNQGFQMAKGTMRTYNQTSWG